MKSKTEFKSELDYVEFYAKKLLEDNKYFEQHRVFINSQFKNSQDLFRTRFGTGEEFKEKARKYLREIGILK